MQTSAFYEGGKEFPTAKMKSGPIGVFAVLVRRGDCLVIVNAGLHHWTTRRERSERLRGFGC